MFNVNEIIGKINDKVSQLQNYRQITMELSSPDKLRIFRQDLINFFFDVEREFKFTAQMINSLSSENRNLTEKLDVHEKKAGELYFENLSLKEKLLKEENKIGDLVNTNSFLELQVRKKDDEIERLKNETGKPKTCQISTIPTQVKEFLS